MFVCLCLLLKVSVNEDSIFLDVWCTIYLLCHELLSQITNLVLELINYISVLGYWCIRCDYIRSYVRFDVLSSIGVFKRIMRVLECQNQWGYSCYHHSTTVSSKRVLEYPSQLGVPVWYMHLADSLLYITQCINAIRQCQQRAIDVSSFNES